MLSELLSNQYVQVVLILIASLIVAKIVKEIILVFLHKATEKTKTDLDDVLIKIISKPLYLSVFLLGIHLALQVLHILNGYTPLVNKLFFVIYVLIVSYVISRILTQLVTRWFNKKRQQAKTPKLITGLVTLFVYIIGILTILSFFNIEITPILATLGIGSIAIGLALQKTLENLFAGLHIISDEPVKVGDFIEIGTEVTGYVMDIGWRSTRVKTLGGDIIVLPNSKLSESIITNLSSADLTVSAAVECGVDYSSNLDSVEKITLEVANKVQSSHEGAVQDYTPGMKFNTFGDSNINFKVFLRATTRGNKASVQHDFIKELKARFDEEKIEISWPVVKVVNVK